VSKLLMLVTALPFFVTFNVKLLVLLGREAMLGIRTPRRVMLNVLSCGTADTFANVTVVLPTVIVTGRVGEASENIGASIVGTGLEVFRENSLGKDSSMTLWLGMRVDV
jgi:hypothetical protein